MGQKNPKPDVSSVRSLITSVTVCARACKVVDNSVYRWIKVDRIPGKYLVTICNLYDVEIRDILHLTGSDKNNTVNVVNKPKATLATLQRVYTKDISLKDAALELGVSERSLHLIMFHWGDELPTLYTTLKQLDEKRISLDEACKRLKVTKYTLHGIRKKYGYAPGKLKRVRPLPQRPHKQALQRKFALDVIAARCTAEQASLSAGCSYRTMFRAIERLSPHKLQDLSHWPRTFRLALAEEIDKNLPNFAEKWVKLAENMRLVLNKEPRYPQKPENWAKQPLKRLLAATLLDEATLQEIATARGGEAAIIQTLFTGDLVPLGVTYDDLLELPVAHQLCVAEIMLAMVDRRRKVEI